MTDEGRLYDDAPPILKLVAVIAALVVVVVSLPAAPSTGSVCGIVMCTMLGLAMVWFPHYLAYMSHSEIEWPLGLVRLAGWVLIALPLLLSFL